jgi:hypothetical protein
MRSWLTGTGSIILSSDDELAPRRDKGKGKEEPKKRFRTSLTPPPEMTQAQLQGIRDIIEYVDTSTEQMISIPHHCHPPHVSRPSARGAPSSLTFSPFSPTR